MAGVSGSDVGANAVDLADHQRGLLARVTRGDASAFADLIEPHLPHLLRTARAILGNEIDARDATQEACVAAWVKIGTLRDTNSFDAWLGRILTNRCRDTLRRRSRSREVDLSAADLIAATTAADTDGMVMSAFDRLSLRDREVLVLHYLHDLPVLEIGRRLRIPEGTAKSRLFNARKNLQRVLEAER